MDCFFNMTSTKVCQICTKIKLLKA